MLSAYRELKSEENDLTELNAHLEGCAGCRATLAMYNRIGAQVHEVSVPPPPPEVREKLMKALANEQLKYMQKSAPGKVTTPDFLKPYLQERAEEVQGRDDIAAFSTAETGPLPMLHTRRKRRNVSVNQFAIIGLAAAILIMLMTGGLTSLLMLARSNPTPINKTTSSLAQPTEVEPDIYTTNTQYPNIVSSLPSGNMIYYTASGNGANANSWMLMQFDRNILLSKPLLNAPATHPLILLQASHDWLVWLEYSLPQTNVGTDSKHLPSRDWSLHYLSLLPQAQNTSTSSGTPDADPTATATPNTQGTPTTKDGKSGQTSGTNPPAQNLLPNPLLLDQGVFDSETAPVWVADPIQGSWLQDNTLLVTAIDQKGNASLKSYTLSLDDSPVVSQTLAVAPSGHILSWPTTDSSASNIYWADEWVAKDGTLHSNVWQRAAVEETLRSNDYLEDKTTYLQKVLLGDGLSFQPQVVNDTLFFLSSSEVSFVDQQVIRSGIPLPPNPDAAPIRITPHVDPRIYHATPDATQRGTVFMLALSGLNAGTEETLGTVGQAVNLQAGSNYVIWQEDTAYKMYDVRGNVDVVLGNTLDDASMLILNGPTTLWFTSFPSTGGTVTMMMYNWPK